MNDVQPLDTTIADELIIDNLETLKVLADQLRKRIIEQFDQPRTVKEVAQKLSTSPSKLYYHVNLLEEHGLLKVTDTRIVSGIIEKQYQAAARVFRVKLGLLSPTPEDGDAGLEAMLTHFFDQPREEARRSIRAGIIRLDEDSPPHLRLQMSSVKITLTPEQAEDYYARLRALVEEFQHVGHRNEGEQTYAAQLIIFPVGETSDTEDTASTDTDE